MTERKINRGSEIRTKGKSMGRERSGASADPSDRSSSGATGPAPASRIAVLKAAGDTAGESCWRRCDPRAVLFLAGRVALMLAGIAVMALGIDVVVKADLGNSPISATPNVLALGFPAVSFGAFMLGWQCFLVLVQVALLRREFRLVDLWQIPISVFFGLCIDWFMALLGAAAPTTYLASWLWLAVGMAVLAAGIVMTVVSGTVMNCGEAVVQAVVRKTGARFGTVKVGFDLACAALAVLCALVFVGHLAGVREGTVACAALTGVVVNGYMALYGRVRQGARRWRAGAGSRVDEAAASLAEQS
ncbi:YczE/YyaS/YitT family protein [Adlercreutzia caecimuris]|uniref:YczE/YyaS/YitT family protein n=1 Tax=Adlercreutzia caecimuris TaxID=671266 RepID=UPI0013649E98|nr:DUF6198 family protein [Adlercreutzia caecimuris]NBJ66286.1 hypothetical protein [Adlercreutzia caecimuris]